MARVNVPAFVDLHGRDATVDAALRGGFRVRFLVAGALTKGLRGDEIADLGLLVRAGATVLSNGGVPLKNARVLRHVLEYAGRTGVPVMLRAADPDLEAGGVVREGPRGVLGGLLAVEGDPLFWNDFDDDPEWGIEPLNKARGAFSVPGVRLGRERGIEPGLGLLVFMDERPALRGRRAPRRTGFCGGGPTHGHRNARIADQ